MSTTTYTVTGMTCEHCVMSVKEEVGEVTGVTGVDVDLGSGRVAISSAGQLDDRAVRAAIVEAGYEVTS
jgi:copper chaperone